jgi:hypothetical protein
MRKTKVIKASPAALEQRIDTWIKCNPRAEIIRTSAAAINEYNVLYVIIYEEKPI